MAIVPEAGNRAMAIENEPALLDRLSSHRRVRKGLVALG
jgi:hypothetical protein